MSRIHATTNFRDNNGVDLGKKLITKDYLISVYPSIGQKIGIPPELWVWGGGTPGITFPNGELGNGVNASTTTPITTSSGGTNWKQVSCGKEYTAAIKTDGSLWTWGQGTNGQLGNGAITGNILTPVTTFAGGTNWKQVSAGNGHTAAIKTDGTLWTWGPGTSGILGNAVTTNVSTPVTTFAGGTNWKQVSCGAHTAAIKTDGTLWTWGGGARLGNGTTTGTFSTPVTTFAGGTNWKQVDCGSFHTAAIKTDGTLWIWGSGAEGRLGNGVTTGNISTPVTTFAGGTNWKQVDGGYRHTAAIKTDGTLWTWGSEGSGRLGNIGVNITSYKTTPVTTFAGGNNWKQVICGDSHTAAIKTDGTLWTWGSSSDGRLGNATNAVLSRSTPLTTFAGGTNWKQVSTSDGNHTAAIKSVDF